MYRFSFIPFLLGAIPLTIREFLYADGKGCLSACRNRGRAGDWSQGRLSVHLTLCPEKKLFRREMRTMETLPARVDLAEIQSLADLMVKSKMFTDVKDIAQGAVRILAGRELGIGPVASLRSIEIVQGQLSMRSHLIAAMIKRSPRYNYRVTVSTNEKCVIEFLENGEVLGQSEFTMDDAARAKLTSNNTWLKYPKTMLYNRAMSQGARMYCPDIFLGGVFYESEIIEAEAVPVPEPEPEPVEMATSKQLGSIYGSLKYYGVIDGDKRALIEFLYPDGLPKDDATKLIDHIKTQNTLPAHIRQGYIRMWTKVKGADRQEVAAHMDKTYGHHDPAKLNNAQFTILVEHLAGDDIPEPEENDVYRPETEIKDVTIEEWAELIKNKCTACQLTATQFEKWGISQFGKGTITDMSKLPKEVYYSLNAMDNEVLKSEVESFFTTDAEQVTLVS